MLTFIAAMRRYLITLIIICASLAKVCGQSASAAIDSLIKFKVITPAQRQIIEREIKHQSDFSYPTEILGALDFILVEKEYHINPHKTGFFISYKNDKIHKLPDSVKNSQRVLLEKINKAGLLSSRVYNSTLKDVDSGLYFVNVQLIGHLAEMTSRLERLAPNKLLPVAEQLHKAGVVSDSSFLRLKDDITKEKIEQAIQLIDYCSHVKVFNMANYSNDPKTMLGQVLHDMASMLPRLNFTGFNVTTRPDTAFNLGNIPETRYLISLVCNGRVYKYAANSIGPTDTSGRIFTDALFANSFMRVFNKILTDQQSPFRLHSMLFAAGNGNGDYSIHHFAVIALRDEQAEVLWEKPLTSYVIVSMEDHNQTQTSVRVDTTIAGWKKMGLFDHLSDAQLARAIDDTEAGDWYLTDQLITNFPNVVLNMNTAIMSPRPLYKNLLIKLAKITHGAFKPTEIKEHKVRGRINLQYSFNGKKHVFTFASKGGWFDENFSVFVKQLGEQNKLGGDFYELPDAEAFVYLTEQQYAYALNHKLLNFSSRK